MSWRNASLADREWIMALRQHLHLHCNTAAGGKFWIAQIHDDPPRVTVNWGPTRSQGQTKSYSVNSLSEAFTFVSRKKKEKLAKGYNEVASSQPREPTPPTPRKQSDQTIMKDLMSGDTTKDWFF